MPERSSGAVQVRAKAVMQAGAEAVVPECLRGRLLVQSLQQRIRYQKIKSKPSSGQEQELPSSEIYAHNHKFAVNKKTTLSDFEIKLSSLIWAFICLHYVRL